MRSEPLPMTLQARVAAFARSRFGETAVVEKLPGDASDRAFFRLRGGRFSSLILMVHREPFELESLPFFQHARFLTEIGAAVPQIVASYPGEGILAVQDLGDDTLFAALPRCDPGRRRFLYLQAVQMLAFLQGEGTRSVTPDLPAANTALDAARLLWELRFFAEHYVAGLMLGPLDEAQAAALDAWFVRLAGSVARQRRVLCHRDYHSRNLMVKGDRLYMVDFQDARMGPYTYDLASLVRDSYIDLPAALVAETTEFFREASGAPETAETFALELNRAGLQRNLKAIGTFASQAMVKGNRFYLEYIPRTLASVRAALAAETEEFTREGELDLPALFAGPLDYRDDV